MSSSSPGDRCVNMSVNHDAMGFFKRHVQGSVAGNSMGNDPKGSLGPCPKRHDVKRFGGWSQQNNQVREAD